MGVTINKNAIVAAGAIVTHDRPENSVVAGITAKVNGTYEEAKEKHRQYNRQYVDLELKEPCTVREMLDAIPIDFDDE